MDDREVKKLLKELLDWIRRESRKKQDRQLGRTWQVVGELNTLTSIGAVKMKMTDTQEVDAKIENAVDGAGQPTGATPTSVNITLDKPDFLNFSVSADNTEVTFVAKGTLGSTQITAEVKFSDGTDLTVIDTLEVIAGATAKFGFDFGTPTEQAPAAPAPAPAA